MNDSAEWWGVINEQMKKYTGMRNVPTKVADLEVGHIAQPVSPVSRQTPQPTQASSPTKQPVQQLPPRVKAASPQPVPISSTVSLVPAQAAVSYFPPEIENESKNISAMSLTDQMEMKLQARTGGSGGSGPPEMMPTFEPTSKVTNPNAANNAWNSLDSNPGGW
jgi:hypothetical protein